MHTIAENTRDKAPGLTRRHGIQPGFVFFEKEGPPTAPETPTPDRDSLVSRVSSKSYIRPYFRSRIVAKENIEKPWMDEPKSKWPVLVPYLGIIIGLILAGYQMYLGWASVIQNKYCLVMEDNFDGDVLNSSIWNYETQLGGFG